MKLIRNQRQTQNIEKIQNRHKIFLMKTDVDIFPILNMDKHQCSFTSMWCLWSPLQRIGLHRSVENNLTSLDPIDPPNCLRYPRGKTVLLVPSIIPVSFINSPHAQKVHDLKRLSLSIGQLIDKKNCKGTSFSNGIMTVSKVSATSSGF